MAYEQPTWPRQRGGLRLQRTSSWNDWKCTNDLWVPSTIYIIGGCTGSNTGSGTGSHFSFLNIPNLFSQIKFRILVQLALIYFRNRLLFKRPPTLFHPDLVVYEYGNLDWLFNSQDSSAVIRLDFNSNRKVKVLKTPSFKLVSVTSDDPKEKPKTVKGFAILCIFINFPFLMAGY